MAKMTLPKRTVVVCDFCKRGGFLEECDVCGKEVCLTCRGVVGQTGGFTVFCRECAKREDVRTICHRYADKLTPIYRKRYEALRRLGTRRKE